MTTARSLTVRELVNIGHLVGASVRASRDADSWLVEFHEQGGAGRISAAREDIDDAVEAALNCLATYTRSDGTIEWARGK